MKIFFKNFTPADKLNFYFILFLQLILLMWNKNIENFHIFLGINTLFLIYLLLICNRKRSKNKILTFLQLWYPVIFIPVIFTQFRFIIPGVRNHDMDLLLLKLDRMIFGKDPSILVEKFLNPFFVDILQLSYSFFYFIPLITGIYIVYKRDFEEYDFFYFYICYGFFLSYLGYLMVPAIGPRFILKNLYSVPIQGHFIYKFLITLQNSIEKIHRDCFPSGHTMVVLMVLHYNFKRYKKLFYIFLVPSIFLLMATIFLRYHYLVDLIGGLLFFLFVLFTAKPFWKFLKENL